MPYLIFGFALGIFVCGLIEKFHKTEENSWINSFYLFGLSGLGFLLFIFAAWPILKRLFA